MTVEQMKGTMATMRSVCSIKLKVSDDLIDGCSLKLHGKFLYLVLFKVSKGDFSSITKD